MQGVRRLQQELALAPGDIAAAAHGTTLAANTLIERKGAVTGLIATAGFRDILQIGNDTRYDMYDLAIGFPEPLVPRPLRMGVAERTAADGTLVQAVDLDAGIAAARALRAAGAQALLESGKMTGDVELDGDVLDDRKLPR